MKAKFFLILFFVFSFLCGDNQTNKHKKDEIDNEIQKLQSQKKSLLNDIYRNELLYEKELIKLRNIQLQAALVNKEISLLLDKKTLLSQDLIQTKQNLARAIRILHKTSSQPPILFIMRIDTMSNLFRHYHYFGKIFSYKSSILSTLRKNLTEMELVENQYKAKQKDLNALHASINANLILVQKQKSLKISFLGKINKDQSHYRQLLEEIKSQTTELNKVITDQPYLSRIKDIQVEHLKGKLHWPLKGKILNRFGKVKSTQFNTYVFNNGIKIRPDRSDDIKSVLPGVVLLSTYFKGYGKLIILRHAHDFYTLYGHCKEIFKDIGDWVSQGDIIATAGDSGSTVGKALYFEVRKGINSEDPIKWLKRQ
jgi:septal ring factor EnvC (AmiA/AmiB activator)